MADNAVLRGGAKNIQQIPAMKKRFKELCCGNMYTTTIHVINSALLKLSKLVVGTSVYRGFKGGVLPRQFWVKSSKNFRGGVEQGFMSTTTNEEVAVFYSGAGENGAVSTVIEAQLGMVDRGVVCWGEGGVCVVGWLPRRQHKSVWQT